VTGEVIILGELLQKTLYRASAKILESSAIIEDEDEYEDDDDDEVQVYGTDGQMKDMGEGKYVVVKTRRAFEVSGVANGKRKMGEDPEGGEPAEKRVCTLHDKVLQCKKSDDGMFNNQLFIHTL
jgi:hypothetical protein